MAGKPPLELHAEVTTASGSKFRWDSGGPAANVPQGISFRTKRGEGFADASVTLSRRIDQDYVDLSLFDDFALVGYGGSVAYEGRLGSMPRSLSDRHQISVQFAGWMTHARDRKFAEIYVDRDTGAWGDMSLNRKAALAGSNDFAIFSWTTDPGGLVCALPKTPVDAQATSETWYVAPVGCTVAKVMYVGAESIPVGYRAANIRSDDNDAGSSPISTSLTLDSTLRTATPSAAERYVYLELYANATAATPTLGQNRRLSKLGVYGNHGLTTRTIDSTTPDGLYASDVITDIASRFCPRFSTSGVQATTFAIPHLTFKDRTDPYDAFLEINKFHLWDLGVWENKTLTFRPFDLSDYDWEVRLSDLGVQVDLQGDSTQELANGIVVEYTDVLTGEKKVLTPDDTTSLSDTSVTNPANTHGLKVWTEISLSSPTTAEAAAQIGVAALAEYNQPKAPGTIRVRGHIKDRAGHWQQGWKVRAGDTVSITDHPDDRPRLVVETEWDHDSKTLTIATDSTMKRLDAVLDRVSTALTAANLS